MLTIWRSGFTVLQRVEYDKVRKKKKIRNRYNQVPHLTQDTVWESDKNVRKHHIQGSQEISPFPAGDHKAARHRQDNMVKTNIMMGVFGTLDSK